MAECLKAVRRILVALERFDKNDYLKFSDPSSFHKDLSPEIAGKLVSISKIYEKFEDLHNSLRELEKTCTRDAANVQAQRSQLNLTLNMKNNDMAKHHTFIACFTILVSFRSRAEAVLTI